MNMLCWQLKDRNNLFIYRMGTAKEHKFDFTELDQGVEFLSYSEVICYSKMTLAVYF